MLCHSLTWICECAGRFGTRLHLRKYSKFHFGCSACCTEGCEGGVWLRRHLVTLVGEIAVNIGDYHRAFTDGRSHALDRVRADVSNGVNAGNAGCIWSALEAVDSSGQDESFFV